MGDTSRAELIITFPNTHDAIMGERILLDSGLDVRVMPMPIQLGPACGIALRIDPADLEMAKSLLGETIGGIYFRADQSSPSATNKNRETFVPWNP
ncbi:hypothetical protein AGMMS50293_29120 [Spirochaetia bacterium]|nr:hypothetical protein AGMMS50293_29120 [Spirochaetia bacterium]